MLDNIIITTKSDLTVSVPLHKLRSPRAVLAFILEALMKNGNRLEIIQAIQFMEKHLGIELGTLEVKKVKTKHQQYQQYRYGGQISTGWPTVTECEPSRAQAATRPMKKE